MYYLQIMSIHHKIYLLLSPIPIWAPFNVLGSMGYGKALSVTFGGRPLPDPMLTRYDIYFVKTIIDSEQFENYRDLKNKLRSDIETLHSNVYQ